MDRRLLEQIDACRHGPGNLPRENLRAPEVADLSAAVARGDEAALRAWSRVAAADVAIQAALHDVPVPNDLGERLLMALKAVAHGEPADAAALGPHSEVRSPTGVPAIAASAMAVSTNPVLARADLARQAKATRRAWLGWAMAAVTVAIAACAAFVLLYPWSPAFVTQEEVAQDIHGLYNAEIVRPSDWTVGAPVNDLTIFSQWQFPPPQRWRELTVNGHGATAYDLDPALVGKRATLLVIERRVRGLEFSPPEHPECTQGRCIGVWQSETQVFALVVEGSLSDYQRLIGPQASIA